MRANNYVKKIVTTAVCISLCTVLPLLFHAIPDGGTLFSPMHLPVFLCGMLCGWPFGLFCGIAGPLLSSLITGMPPLVYLPPMLIELAVYGLVSGIMMRFVHTKHLYADLYISLVTAMLAGRVLAGLAKAWFFTDGGYSMAIWFGAYFVGSWPGILAQLVLIPILVVALARAGLIQSRYDQRKESV